MRCLLCDKEIGSDDLYDLLWSEDVLCRACRKQWQRMPHGFRFKKMQVEALWVYNDAFSRALLQYKECNDEALEDVFLIKDRRRLHWKYRGWTVALMPSSPEKYAKRGFSHLEGMFAGLGLPMIEPFMQITSMDQKQKDRRSRQLMANNIRWKEGCPVPQKILLCDDTITTGATLVGAARAIPQKCRIKILCASANEAWIHKKTRIG